MHRMILVPVEQYNRMIESYDKAMEELKEVKDQLKAMKDRDNVVVQETKVDEILDREIALYELMDRYNCDRDVAVLILQDQEQNETPGAATPRESK